MVMQARRKIAVAGATGRVGRHVVDVLEARGHDAVAMARSRGVDVVTGDGLAEALTGVECVIDAATWPSPDQEAATAFFTAAARNLHEAGVRAGAQRSSTSSSRRWWSGGCRARSATCPGCAPSWSPPGPLPRRSPTWPPTPNRCHYRDRPRDRKSTRLNSSHVAISYAVLCLKKKKYTIYSYF